MFRVFIQKHLKAGPYWLGSYRGDVRYTETEAVEAFETLRAHSYKANLIYDGSN